MNGSSVSIEIVTEVDDVLQEAILRIDEEAFGPGSLNEWSLPLFIHYGRVYIARCDGEPIGVAELMRDWQDPEMVYLYGCAITSRFRGTGTGTLLLRSILTDLPRAGFRRLQLTVHPQNQVALHIYQNIFGMRRIDFIKNYYGHGEDRLLLEWNWKDWQR